MTMLRRGGVIVVLPRNIAQRPLTLAPISATA
jgi:hypothetical protein